MRGAFSQWAPNWWSLAEGLRLRGSRWSVRSELDMRGEMEEVEETFLGDGSARKLRWESG